MKKIWQVGILLAIVLIMAGCVQAVPADSGAAADGEAAGAMDMLAAIQEAGKIRISTDANYEPQSFLNENGEFVGFDIDVAREIAKRLGVEVDFVTPDWDLITAGNWGGQWDMSVGSMTVTTARSEVLDFVEPAYYYTPAQFAATVDSGITTLEGLNGQTICVGLSTTYETWLSGDLEALGLPESSYYHEPPTDISILPLQTDNECAQQIQAGRNEFVAFLTSGTVVDAAIREDVPVQKVNGAVYSENLAVAFDKASDLDNTSLMQKVGEIITEMHEDGTLSEFSMNWFGEDLTKDPTK
jgi:polar amino acid transport system substrate-binding protein